MAERDQQIADFQEEAREIAILKRSIKDHVMHEIRTPMLQVKSAISSLDAEIRTRFGDSGEDAEGMLRLINYATQATSRLNDVIQNINQLALSFALKSEPFRLIDSLTVAQRQLGRSWSAGKHVHRVVSTIAEDLALVQGDRNAIGQVLYQLIENGLKFSPEGSPVTVSADMGKAEMRVRVTDLGIGIDPEKKHWIFQEFYIVDSETTRSYNGAGVGLAIVKLILDRMKCEITVKSSPNQGSEFSFTLPYAT